MSNSERMLKIAREISYGKTSGLSKTSCQKTSNFNNIYISISIEKYIEMHLTLINFFKKTVPGHIFRGKRRLVKPVSRRAMDTLRREYEREEQVMLLLRHPYLTVVSAIGINRIVK